MSAVPETAACRWSLWSTTVEVVVTRPGLLEVAVGLVSDHLVEVDAAVNRFRDDSEIRRLPSRPTDLFRRHLLVALDSARATGGAVDPTVGTALNRLGYDRDLALVEDGGLRAVLRRVPGWGSIRVRSDRIAVPDGVVLDLGATSKALAADDCAALVAAQLDTGVLVSLGGDVATAGAAPAGGWRIRVDSDVGSPQDVLVPGRGAIATSSTQRRVWTRGGVRLHHIVDPRTGRPAEPVWAAATVSASSCWWANAAATAAVVFGREAASWLSERDLPARLVATDGTVTRVAGWPEEVLS